MTVTTKKSAAVLFVDDEENILRSVVRLFMDEPYEVITAGSGAEGLDALRSGREISVIVSDQRMPGMSGAEFLEQAREIAPDAVRIILTGYADAQAAVDAINRGGAWRYLSKPWNDDDLLRTVRGAKEHYDLVKENKSLTEIVKKQNEELKRWNSDLEAMVQRQTLDIQNKNKDLETLNERLRKNFSDSLAAFSSLLELRDRSAGNHSRSVSELSGAMARAMKLPADEIAAIAVAGLLHDIGKIGMPDALLCQRPEDMSSEDRQKYMEHPILGQTAVDSIEDLRRAGILIRHHHERWDGSGFPDRLKGQSIPIGARIIAVADCFDRALLGCRGRDRKDGALSIVKQAIGSYLDPSLFRVLEEVAQQLKSIHDTDEGAHELELRPEDLKEGMILTRDVRSGTGLLLLSAGTELTQKSIEAIKRYFQIDPSRANIFARYCS